MHFDNAITKVAVEKVGSEQIRDALRAITTQDVVLQHVSDSSTGMAR